MGILADALRSQAAATDDGPYQAPESEPSKGLRGGVASLSAQLNAFAGSAGRSAGLTNFADGRDEAVRRNLAEAQEADRAAATPTWDGVHDLRSGLNWAGYKAGQALPALVGGVAAGAAGAAAAPALGIGAGVGALAGSTLAFTPVNAGDIALRNPNSAFSTQLAGGAISALAENALPGALGGRLAGAGLREGATQAAKRTLSQTIQHQGAENILGQGAAMGVGEGVKQAASGQEYDDAAMKDAALGGAVMGIPLAGGHVAADVLTGTPVKGVNAIRDAAKAAKDRVSEATGTPGSPEVPEAPKSPSPLERMRKAFTPKEDDGLAKVAEGQPLNTENEIAGAAGQEANDKTAFEKVRASLSEMAEDVGISPEMRQSAKDTLDNLASHPSAVRMGATLASGWKAAKEKAEGLKDFVTDSVKDFNARQENPGGTDARITDKDSNTIDADAKEVKRSDDFSGERKVLTDVAAPWLQKNSPDTLNDPEAMKNVGELFRQVLHHTYTSDAPLPEGIKNGLFQHFGDDTTKLLDQMNAARGDTPPAQLVKHADQMGNLAADQKAFGSLKGMVQKALEENGHADSMDAGELTRHMMDWYARDPRNREGAGTDEFLVAKASNEARQVQDLMESTLGKHTKKIQKALESEILRQRGVHEEATAGRGRDLPDEDEHMYDEGEGDNNSSDPAMDRVQYGGGKSKNQPLYDPAKFKAENREGQNYGQQALYDAQAKHPDRKVAWKSEKELGVGKGREDHGFVVAEKLADSDGFQGQDYKRMAFNTKSYGGDKAHPSRIDVDGHTLDATKIERAGAKHMQRTGIAPEGDALARKNQALLHGISQLMIEHPEFKPSPDLVVRHTDGKPVTLKEIKGADTVGVRSSARTKAQETLDGMETHEIESIYRRNHNAIKEAEDKLREHVAGLVAQRESEIGAELPAWRARELKYELFKDKDLREHFGLNELESKGRTLSSELFKRERSDSAQDMLAKNGQQDIGEDANIHQIQSLKGSGNNGEHRITTNMDGTPRYTQTRSTGGGGEKARGHQGHEAVVDRGHELIAAVQAKTGLQSRTGNTLGHAMLQLSEHMDAMTPRERASLVAMTHHEATTDVIAKTLAPLQDKYLGADWKAPEPAKTAKGDVPKQSNLKDTKVQGPSNHELGSKADAPWEKVFGKDFGRGEAKPSETAAKSTRDLADKRNGSNLFGGNPDPKAVAAEKAASSGKSLERLQREFPDMALRRASPEEQAHIDGVLDRVKASLGDRMPEIQGIQVHDTNDQKFAGKAVTRESLHHIILNKQLFDDHTLFTGSLEGKVERAVAHEVGHLLDRELGNYSDNHDDFFRDGDLHGEIQAAMEKNGTLRQWYAQAMTTARNPQRELFSQSFALYQFNPEVMREVLPKTYEAIKALTERGSRGPAEAGRAGVQAEAGGGVSVQQARFTEAVRKGDPKVLEELKTSNDPKSLQRAVEALAGEEPTPEVMKATDVANARIAELLHANPDTAYGMQTKKYSLEGTLHERGSRSATEAVKDYLDRVTPWVRQQLDRFMPHAGEYDPAGVIRVAVNALNPRSTAYHESMHAFFHDLMTKGHGDVVDVLQKVADSPVVLAQMKQFFKDEIGVLRQLKNDPEERVAVMYQMWAQGKLNLAPKAEGLFGRIGQFLRGLIGHWTNEEHAEHIMNYFHSGEYAEDRLEPSVVAKALMSKNLTQVAAQIRTLAKPLTHLAEEVVGSGGQNLRDTNVPSLQRIAELVKKKYTDEGRDAGYIPASREAYTERANKLAGLVEGADESVQREALQALQTGKVPTSPEAKALHQGIRALLDEAHSYLTAAGVKLGDLGVGKDYFPRTWDPHYLSKNKEAFMDMARHYPEWHNPEETYNKLVAADGSELQVVGQPGMGSNKERVLSFISHEDAAPFMTKELLPIVSSYLQQATRKAEWARRFGGDNHRMNELLDQARREGATVRDIKNTERYIQAVNGTLGDDLNPTARRLMGDMIVYQNIRLLPLAFFSGIVDPMGIAVRGGGVGNAWKAFTRGISEISAGLKGTGSKDAATKLAEDLDVISKASLTHALGATYTQGVVGGTARKINDTFFRFNLMEQWNTSMRVGATEAALQFIAKHSKGESVHSARYMKELGLNPSDVKMVDGRVATGTHEGLSLEQAARIKSAVNQWVDGAMLRPDAADKAVWMSDPHFMLISHLKQFVYAFHHTILGRVVHEAKNGNYSPAMALMGYVPIMIAADAAKGFIQTGGGVPSWKKDWGVGDYLENGIERAGLYGVGQIGLDAARGNFGSVTGPSIEQLGDAMKTLAGRETYQSFILHSMPANALYANAFGGGKADPTFAE